MSSHQDRLFLIDGSSLIFRSFYGLPMMTRADHTPVNAVFGFCQTLMRWHAMWKFSRAVVLFDTAAPTFRHQADASYKAHRPPPSEELIPQFSLVREACEAFGILHIAQEGVEADDLIATLATKNAAQNHKVMVVSTDKDMMSLVTEGTDTILFYNPKTQRVMDAAAIKDYMGVRPSQIMDMLSLMGDASDGITGVPGVGPKTAKTLIESYGSLESLYENLSHVQPASRQNRLKDHEASAFHAKKMVTLATELNLSITSDHVSAHRPAGWHDFLREQGFTRLIKNP